MVYTDWYKICYHKIPWVVRLLSYHKQICWKVDENTHVVSVQSLGLDQGLTDSFHTSENKNVTVMQTWVHLNRTAEV